MLGSCFRWQDLASVLPLLQADNEQEYYLPDAVNQLKSVMALMSRLPGNTRYQ